MALVLRDHGIVGHPQVKRTRPGQGHEVNAFSAPIQDALVASTHPPYADVAVYANLSPLQSC